MKQKSPNKLIILLHQLYCLLEMDIIKTLTYNFIIRIIRFWVGTFFTLTIRISLSFSCFFFSQWNTMSNSFNFLSNYWWFSGFQTVWSNFVVDFKGIFMQECLMANVTTWEIFISPYWFLGCKRIKLVLVY